MAFPFALLRRARPKNESRRKVDGRNETWLPRLLKRRRRRKRPLHGTQGIYYGVWKRLPGEIEQHNNGYPNGGVQFRKWMCLRFSSPCESAAKIYRKYHRVWYEKWKKCQTHLLSFYENVSCTRERLKKANWEDSLDVRYDDLISFARIRWN